MTAVGGKVGKELRRLAEEKRQNTEPKGGRGRLDSIHGCSRKPETGGGQK